MYRNLAGNHFPLPRQHLHRLPAKPRFFYPRYRRTPNRFLSTVSKEPAQKPLRILFCGSDRFSCASLEALFRDSQTPQSPIKSINVVCREGKRAGRGLKLIRHPEIVDTASKLGLPLHHIKTFTGWEPPQFPGTDVPRINLIVAVSFGLKIPPRILSASEFSGINLHPSLLPLYKGPAPLHWTILNGDTRTGMSLQTLHPTSFDEGVVLDQTPWPRIELPKDCDYQTLEGLMMELGPKMLIDAIHNRLYEPPYRDVGWAKNDAPGTKYGRAPKVGTSDRFLAFSSMDSSQLTRISRAFDATWAMASSSDPSDTSKKLRLIFNEQFESLAGASDECIRIADIPPGLPYQVVNVSENFTQGEDQSLLINTVDGKTFRISRIKVEGDREMPAYGAALKHSLLGRSVQAGSRNITTFFAPLS